MNLNQTLLSWANVHRSYRFYFNADRKPTPSALGLFHSLTEIPALRELECQAKRRAILQPDRAIVIPADKTVKFA
jgi:hypothetical protein